MLGLAYFSNSLTHRRHLKIVLWTVNLDLKNY